MIEKRGITKVLIRSVLTCDVEHGVCVKCYGKNLATDKDAEIGDALGIIAAQSIGEPGTQLTMRTFHIGGISSGGGKEPVITARQSGTVRFENLRLVTDQKGNTLVVNKNGFIIVYDEAKAKEMEVSRSAPSTIRFSWLAATSTSAFPTRFQPRRRKRSM